LNGEYHGEDELETESQRVSAANLGLPDRLRVMYVVPGPLHGNGDRQHRSYY
jgi:hypothetical protein